MPNYIILSEISFLSEITIVSSLSKVHKTQDTLKLALQMSSFKVSQSLFLIFVTSQDPSLSLLWYYICQGKIRLRKNNAADELAVFLQCEHFKQSGSPSHQELNSGLCKANYTTSKLMTDKVQPLSCERQILQSGQCSIFVHPHPSCPFFYHYQGNFMMHLRPFLKPTNGSRVAEEVYLWFIIK